MNQEFFLPKGPLIFELNSYSRRRVVSVPSSVSLHIPFNAYRAASLSNSTPCCGTTESKAKLPGPLWLGGLRFELGGVRSICVCWGLQKHKIRQMFCLCNRLGFKFPLLDTFLSIFPRFYSFTHLTLLLLLLFLLLQVIALKMFPVYADTWSERAPRDKWCTLARTTKSPPLAAVSTTEPRMRWDITAGLPEVGPAGQSGPTRCF